MRGGVVVWSGRDVGVEIVVGVRVGVGVMRMGCYRGCGMGWGCVGVRV